MHLQQTIATVCSVKDVSLSHSHTHTLTISQSLSPFVALSNHGAPRENSRQRGAASTVAVHLTENPEQQFIIRTGKN